MSDAAALFADEVKSHEEVLEEFFPKAHCPVEATFHYIIVQMKKPITTSRGGIILPDETKDAEYYNTIIGKVLHIGPSAFRVRATGSPIYAYSSPPYGVGDYVLFGKFAGQRFKSSSDGITFNVMNDDNILGVVTDVSEIVNYIR